MTGKGNGVYEYATGKGKRYRVVFRKPDHSQGQKRGFRTKRDAELYLAQIDVSKHRGEYIDATAGRIRISDLGQTWLANQSHLKPSTFRSVDSAWRNWVLPEWGTRSVSEIRHSEVKEWVAKIAAVRSPTTVQRCFGVLASILDDAVQDWRISRNPARGVKLPRKVAKRHVYLTHTQVDLLASNSRGHEDLVYFLAYVGSRWGETTGALVLDLNTARKRLYLVDNAVDVGGKIVVGSPKNHKKRPVAFPDFLLPYLEANTQGKRPDQLLFGDGDKHVRLPDSRRGWFVSAVRKCQAVDPTFLDVTPHDLRHTAASLMVAAGANVKVVQRQLGHASAAMTLDTYADLFEDDLDDVGAALQRARDSRPRPTAATITTPTDDAPRSPEYRAHVAKLLPRRPIGGAESPGIPMIPGLRLAVPVGFEPKSPAPRNR